MKPSKTGFKTGNPALYCVEDPDEPASQNNLDLTPTHSKVNGAQDGSVNQQPKVLNRSNYY